MTTWPRKYHDVTDLAILQAITKTPWPDNADYVVEAVQRGLAEDSDRRARAYAQIRPEPGTVWQVERPGLCAGCYTAIGDYKPEWAPLCSSCNDLINGGE